MDKMNKIQLFSIAGCAAVLLGLLLPFIKIPLFGGLGLIFDMGTLGEASGLMYVVSILGIAVLAYVAYVTFKEKANYMRAAYASAAYFVILLIIFFIIKSKLGSESDLMFVKNLVKLGFGVYMFLIGAVLYFLADKERAKIGTDIPE